MAAMDQDNFSSISWHSEQGGAAASSSSAHQVSAALEEAGSSKQPQRNVDVDMHELDPAGLGAELLDCTVSAPMKEGDGTKDAFISYLITTNVCLPCLQAGAGCLWNSAPFVYLPRARCCRVICWWPSCISNQTPPRSSCQPSLHSLYINIRSFWPSTLFLPFVLVLSFLSSPGSLDQYQ